MPKIGIREQRPRTSRMRIDFHSLISFLEITSYLASTFSRDATSSRKRESQGAVMDFVGRLEAAGTLPTVGQPFSPAGYSGVLSLSNFATFGKKERLHFGQHLTLHNYVYCLDIFFTAQCSDSAGRALLKDLTAARAPIPKPLSLALSRSVSRARPQCERQTNNENRSPPSLTHREKYMSGFFSYGGSPLAILVTSCPFLRVDVV